jgi:16S rRNA (cytidine1402-2'-O)-methyltransferase
VKGRPSAAGSLVLVATPIGNLGDLSPRARDVLGSADVVCCEDTRRTRRLLSASGLSSNPRRLVSLHGHNEAARVPEVLSWLLDGKTVAVVSDAGTPAISDPGRRLVAAAAAAGFVVTEVPGPSSVVAALSVSGLDTDRFCVEGFLPRKGADRRRRLATLAGEERTAVVLEAPGRVAQTLRDLADACGDRPVAVCRELTKLHEEIWRGSLAGAVEVFADRELLGEVVVVVGGAEPSPGPDDAAVAAAVGARLVAGDTPRQAADAVAASLGVARRRAYSAALTQRDGTG